MLKTSIVEPTPSIPQKKRSARRFVEYEKLNEALIQIRKQLSLSDEKQQIIHLLSPGLSPIIEIFFDPVISSDVDQRSPQETLSYMIMLYQRLLLFPDDRKADIHYQLGTLYWKKENRLSAAAYHLEKVWDMRRQSPYLPELIALHTASLNFDELK